MCYCQTHEDEILDDMIEDCVPDDALVRSCCWKRICQVRGLNYHAIDPETWTELCRRRGYLLVQEGPRGF